MKSFPPSEKATWVRCGVRVILSVAVKSPTAGGPGQPVSYELDGRQYVSVMAGRGGNGVSRVWTFVLS